jgi:hypothetical protein
LRILGSDVISAMNRALSEISIRSVGPLEAAGPVDPTRPAGFFPSTRPGPWTPSVLPTSIDTLL